jgi:hypothetical protein
VTWSMTTCLAKEVTLRQGTKANLCLEEELTSFHDLACKVYQVHTSYIVYASNNG